MERYPTKPSAEPPLQRDRTLQVLSIVGAVAAGALIATQVRRRSRAVSLERPRAGIYVHEAVTINRPIADVYGFWRNFENFPTFMSHLASVEVTGSHRSHWRAKGPAGIRVEWEAEITEERENELIAWRSIPGSAVQHSGAVRFEHAPGARGTEVHVELEYTFRAATLARTVARLFSSDPEQQIRTDLRRVKQLLETGEIPVSDGPGLWRPARPAERPETVKALMGVSR